MEVALFSSCSYLLSRRVLPRIERKVAAVLFIASALIGLSLAPVVAQTDDGIAGLEAAVEPALIFPVVGPVSFVDTWGACRSGCSRSHKGVDIFGAKLAPLVAAADGTIVSDRRSALTNAGNKIIIESDDGWRFIYLHLNNDTPGTDDGANPQAWIIASGLRVGDRVSAGQMIGYLGDSGNAETTPAHLHFEIHPPGQSAVNPTAAVQAAYDNNRRVSVASMASTLEGRAEFVPSIDAWYRALLKRPPTKAESLAWADRFDVDLGTNAELIADLTMAKQRRDPAGRIVRAYQVALNRRPNLAEMRSWLAAGDVALDDVVVALLSGSEFQNRHGQLADADFISLMYRQGIGREPTPERLDDWMTALSEGGDRNVLATYLADTYISKDRTWHTLEVVQAYRAGLDRMPTEEEHARWVAHLDGGGLIPDVVTEIRENR